MSNNRKYVIIDTDCGIDDAMAIMLAIYCQQNNLIEILAITCTHGNTSVDNVTKNVCLTLRGCGLENSIGNDIKIYRGCEGPIIGKHKSAPHYGNDGIGGASEEMSPIDVNIESEHAVNALIRLCKQYPKQITLMILGPLTNISLAYLLDNQFFDNLQRIVFMGGTINGIGNVETSVEFNVSRDPEACHIMLTNANCPLIFIPWECGLSNLLTWEIYEKITKLSSEKAKFAQKILAKDYERVKSRGTERKGLILTDILVVVAVVFESLIKSTQEFRTTVELNGIHTRGQLVSDKRTGFTYKQLDAPKVTFIQHFDQEKLMLLLLDLFK